MDVQRTRRQLLVIAIRYGLKRYDDQTTATALKRLTCSALLQVSPGHGPLRRYRLTARGEQVRQGLTERPT